MSLLGAIDGKMPLLGGCWPRQTHFAEAAKCKGKRFRTSPLGLPPIIAQISSYSASHANHNEWRPTSDQGLVAGEDMAFSFGLAALALSSWTILADTLDPASQKNHGKL